jgi:hypothetical protein
MKMIVDEASEIIAKATDDHTLIGGQHRLAVAASLGIMEILFDIQPELIAERLVVGVAVILKLLA